MSYGIRSLPSILDVESRICTIWKTSIILIVGSLVPIYDGCLPSIIETGLSNDFHCKTRCVDLDSGIWPPNRRIILIDWAVIATSTSILDNAFGSDSHGFRHKSYVGIGILVDLFRTFYFWIVRWCLFGSASWHVASLSSYSVCHWL
jgi:hypothetical protein